MARLLLVEDDFSLRLSLKTSLEAAGHEVCAAPSAEEAAALMEDGAFELVILDWNLPGRSGLELLMDWRRVGLEAPVIMLSARDQIAERVSGLEAGADDYLVKPFALEELLARVAVRLRGKEVRSGGELTLGEVRVDLARGRVSGPGGEARLTDQEAKTLAFLAARPGRDVPRAELLRAVWGYRNTALQTRAIDNAIYRLRAKVEADPAQPRHILSVRGVGYRFEP